MTPVHVTISNKIHIAGLSNQQAQLIAKQHSLSNPLYYKMLKMGKVKALYGTPKTFKYYSYDKETNTLSIGRGSESRLRSFLEKHVANYTVSESTNFVQLKTKLAGDITLRSYQQGDIETITAHRQGIIRLGTGYGKTVIAAKLVKDLGKTTLIIVPRSHLLDQFAREFSKWYGYKVGVIQGGKKEVKEITVASIQTLVRHPEIVKEIASKFGMVIVDECHGSITAKQLNVIQSFNPSRLYGLTATPRRTDEQSDAIGFTFGPVIIDKDMERASPTVLRLEFPERIIMSENYHEIIEDQTTNERRNALIQSTASNEVLAGRKVLVLTKRIDHYRSILNGIGIKDGIYSIDSELSQKERSKLLSSFREGNSNFNIIFGTYSMLATGTDIPALDTLIFAGDLKSDVLQEQSAGRILRLFGNKQAPKIIDIVDSGNKILYYQARSRMKFYQSMGWEVV